MTDQNDDLVLQPPLPKKARKTKEKAPEDVTLTVQLERAFKADFEERYSFPIGNVLYREPRDRKILKRLIEDVGYDEARAMVRDFFFRFDKDRYVRFMTSSGNVPNFQKCLDRLVMLRNGGGRHVPDRIADNDSEIDRARGKK